jgi:hypothetical protein
MSGYSQTNAINERVDSSPFRGNYCKTPEEKEKVVIFLKIPEPMGWTGDRRFGTIRNKSFKSECQLTPPGFKVPAGCQLRFLIL